MWVSEGSTPRVLGPVMGKRDECGSGPWSVDPCLGCEASETLINLIGQDEWDATQGKVSLMLFPKTNLKEVEGDEGLVGTTKRYTWGGWEGWYVTNTKDKDPSTLILVEKRSILVKCTEKQNGTD